MKVYPRCGDLLVRRLPPLALAALLIATHPARAGCELEDAGRATIVEILNTESLLLADGRAIRLVGALAPRTQTRWARAMGLDEKLLSALKKHVHGKEVRLRRGGRERDRYGRLLVHVFAGDGDDALWVQEALIRDGLAMAYSFPDSRACVRRLQAAEDEARTARTGLWAQGVFRVLEARDVESMDTLAYSFQIVEGRVEDVADRRGRIYMNFGADWRSDFTATVAPSDREHFAGSRLNLADLEGRTIRVRGWLEQRNGPMIEVTHPEQIELVGGKDSAALGAE